MKKLFLSLIAVATLFAANAQEVAVVKVDPKAILEKVEKAKAPTLDAKKNQKAATWFKYAEALNEAYNINISNIFIGAEAKQIVTTMGAPINADKVPIEKIGDKEYKLYKYPNVDIYFSMDDKVAFYIENNIAYPNALETEEVALLKALSLDPKMAEKINPMLTNLVNNYLLCMQNLFTFKKFKEAIPYAEKAARLQENPAVKDPKFTESYYFAVVCAMQGTEYADAKRNLEVLIKNNDLRDGETLYYLGVVEDKLNNTDAAKRIFEEGVSKFPNNQDILKSLIDLYVRTDEDPSKVIPYIKQAQEKDPKNAVLFIVEGVAYEKMKQLYKSIEAYENAIKIDPTSFIAYYNIGYTYSVLADDLVPEFNKIDYTNKTLYDKKQKEITDLRIKAIDPLKKAHEINPEDANSLMLLKSIYFTMRDSSPEMLKEYEKYNALYEKVKQK